MNKFVNFVYYNIIVYVLYSILDHIFTFFNLYSSSELGTNLFVVPTNSDMTYIIINVVISTLLGYYILGKLKAYLL